jgi:hypothetical protein
MALSREIYRELENTVGQRYISDDPALLDSYTYPLTGTSNHIGPFYNVSTPRGGAVLLPSSTEEVQAIVRVCNKHKIRFKAATSFWSAMGYPSHDNVVQLDLRRMDRILEIDEKNMFAVIEPHVIGATLQAEVMKLGLNTHIHGSGASCSPLASATSYSGAGPSGIFLGSHGENMLGLEWVMPDGDIMRLGSLGSGLGWFCGEGPGPSLRALLRGTLGTVGAMGVFTKGAFKLFPWPGPAQIPVKGIVPAYQAVLPDNFRCYTLAFPTWQAWADAVYKIWDAGIGYIAHRQFNMFGRELKYGMLKILTDPTKTLNDLESVLNDPEVQKVTEEMKLDFQFVLVGMTPRDIEWQERALDKILADTGGWKVAAMKDDPVLRDWTLLYLLKMGHKNLNMVFTGAYDGCFGLGGPPDRGIRYVEEAARFKKEWEDREDTIVAAGGDCMMGSIGVVGGGVSITWECFTCWDPYDKKSTEGAFEFFESSYKFGLEKGMGAGMERRFAHARGNDGYETSKEVRERMFSASPMSSVYRYQQKIKEAFNPNDLGDAYYMTLEEPAK